jgi:hypothetical protein
MAETRGISRLTVSIASMVPRIPKGAFARFGAWNRAGLLVLLLSVFWQSYVAQTHIHRNGHDTGFLAAVSAAPAAGVPQDPSSPIDDDQGNCVLCHVAVQAGAFSVPDAVVLVLPVLLFIGLAEAAVRRTAPVVLASHGWRSRAPPLS